MKLRYFGILPRNCFFTADAAVAGGGAAATVEGTAAEAPAEAAPKAEAPKVGVFERAKGYLKDRGELVQELNTLKGQVTTLQAEATSKDATIANQNAELTELRDGRDTLQAEVDRLETEQTTIEKAASSKTVETMARLGVPAAELPKAIDVAAMETSEELRKKFASITDPSERAAFYAKHEARMLS